jgi:diacylglycerol kinase (ATP)
VTDVWLIANPDAGAGRATRFAGEALDLLREAGIPCRLVTPDSAHASTLAAREAVGSGATAVLACGGDGTVHAVLQGLVGSQVPLGIIAAGSGDDIAAGLGYPTRSIGEEMAAVIRALREDRVRSVDVGEARLVDGTLQWFLGVLTTGFDSSVNERANRMTRLRGQRYNIAMLLELAAFRPLEYVVTIDGHRIVDPGMLVSVGNGPQYGGGMLICPDAVPDDGLLDVTWLGALSRRSLLRLFPTVYKGTHVRNPAVRTFRGRALRIEAPGQVAYADGERIGPLPVEIDVRRSALRVLSG